MYCFLGLSASYQSISHCLRFQIILKHRVNGNRLDKLLEGTVDRRADVRNSFPKINGGNSTLANTFRSKLELLHKN
jgi:hypothetical protein